MTKKQMQQKILSLEKQLKLLYNVVIKNKGAVINDFKLKNQFKIINIYLFVFLSLLFITNNNLVMANETNSDANVPRNNNVNDNILRQQIRTLHALLLNEANLF